MSVSLSVHSAPSRPDPRAVLTLLKPVTWFPPMWAFLCGAVSVGVPLGAQGALLALGIGITGPLVCASSQAVNDWFDREVDAVNEPTRPIPSGRIPGQWGLGIAVGWSLLCLVAALPLGAFGVGAVLLALAFSWAYSAPPVRLKRNGWVGNAAVGFTYEGLAWVTGAGILLGNRVPPAPVLLLAALYSVGAHGIMTLNDFKRMGVRSLPVQLGPDRAARLACVVMAVPQMAVILLLIGIGRPVHAAIVLAMLGAQVWLMRTLLADPRGKAIWYSALGVLLYVLGMLVSAFAVAPWSAG